MLKKGVAVVTAIQNGNASYYPAVRQSITVSVSDLPLIPQNITGFGAIPDQIVGNTYTFTGVTGGGSGNPIQFISNGADLFGNQLTFTKVGIFEVLAFQPGNEQYLSSPYLTRTVRVKKIPQTIQNVPTINPILVGGEISLDAVIGGASTNSLIITSNNPSVATITSKIIKGLALGTAQITIWQAGNEIYENATPLVFEVSVQSSLSLLPQTINGFNLIPILNIGESYTISDVTGGVSGNPIIFTSSNPGIASISGNVLTAISSGSVLITASQSGNLTFLPASPVIQNVTVIPMITNIEDSLTNNDKIVIYPNPSKDFIYVEVKPLDLQNEVSFLIANSTGMIVKKFNDMPMNSGFYKLDVRELKTGIYFLILTKNYFRFSKKIMVDP
jgi:hypothetical protein